MTKTFGSLSGSALVLLALFAGTAVLRVGTPLRAEADGGSSGILYGSCYASPSTGGTGSPITWSVQNVGGGNGNYSYSWSGTDGLSGSGPSAYRTYSYGGTKNASVTITSGDGQSFTAGCLPIYITGSATDNGNYNYNNGYNGNLSVSCYASPNQANLYDSVSWDASVSGGNGYYTYVWSGTDGLYGSSLNVTKTYSSTGYKTATVSITSNGQTVSNSCSVNVGSYSQYGGTYYNGGYNNEGSYGNGGFRSGTGYSSGYPYNYNYPYSSGNAYYPGQTQSNVTLIQNPITPAYAAPTYVNSGAYAAPTSGVFLSQIPATGISFGLKMLLFTLGIMLWSVFAAFMIMQKRTRAGLKGMSVSSADTDRALAFKEANKARKGIR